MTYDKDSFLAGLSVGMSLRYSKRIPAPPNYLTFSSPSSFTLSVGNTTKNWDGTLEYSTDMRTWTIWDGTTTLSSAVSRGTYYLYIKGTGNTIITGNSLSGVGRWVLAGSNISCAGDIRSLLNYIDPDNSIMGEYCFNGMFYDNASLISAPDLPAMSLSRYCYRDMFGKCISLIDAPDLPATTAASQCYIYMFEYCTSLIRTPALPATSLSTNCYKSMFSGCTSLTGISSLPATVLGMGCYEGMFSGCTSLETIPTLPATTLTKNCYAKMFLNCTKIKVSTTQTGEYSTQYRIPPTGTGETASLALNNMFYGTGGTFKSTPSINTTYYTSNTVIS